MIGYAEALGAACLWGSSGIFAVNLFRLGVPPESLALLRPMVGAVFLVGFVGFRDIRTLATDRRGLVVLLLGGGLSVGIFQIAYQLSTDAVGVPSTVAMLYLAPALVAAASGPLLAEWPDKTRIALVTVTLAGVWLSVFGAEDVTATFGSSSITWGLLAGAMYAVYTLFGRFAAPRYGAIRTVVYSTLGACLFLAVLVPTITGPIVWPASGAAWALLIVFGALTMAVAPFLFFDALSRIEASQASVAASIEPVVAAILATTLLSQGLSPAGWVGIGIVVFGVAGVGLTTAPNEAG